MERTALPGVAAPHASGQAAVRVRGLRRWLEPVALRQRLAARWCETVVWFGSLAAAWVFASLALRRHAYYESTAYDFGFFDQIIWNTSRGRWLETSFVDYNFLGQHVEPVLLIFAGFYRLGGGPETLLVIQAALVALAAVPLFYATRRLTDMPVVGVGVAIAYLVSPALHRALDFDFHPELLAPFFLFVGLYFLSAKRPLVAILAVAPVLLLKEDMALVALMFGALVWMRGGRAPGSALAGFAVLWGLSTVFIIMPLVRGGGSDLNERFAYLFSDTSFATVGPVAVSRGASNLATETLPSLLNLLASGGWVAILSPAILLALPSAVLNGLSDHRQQSRLDLQYGVASFSLLFAATALAIGDIAHSRGPIRVVVTPKRAALAAYIATTFVVASAVVSFVLSSPYSLRTARPAPDPAHREVIGAAIRRIPKEASVSAQNTLLPHLSQRQFIFEFPNVPPRVEWVIVDTTLPITQQATGEGYDRVLRELTAWGFAEVFSQDGVRVFSRESDQ